MAVWTVTMIEHQIQIKFKRYRNQQHHRHHQTQLKRYESAKYIN